MGGLEDKVNIAIDGLCSTGKDTITQALFYVLNRLPIEDKPVWTVIDSSKMYRILALFLDENYERLGIERLTAFEKKEKNIQNSIKGKNLGRFVSRLFRLASGYERKVRKITSKILIETDYMTGEATVSGLTELGFEENTITYEDHHVRTTEVDTLVGYVAKFTSARPYIVEMEREIAKEGYCIIPGRDGLSVVLEQGDFENYFGLYLWATMDVRVQRRKGDRKAKDHVIEKEILVRDERDTDPKSNNVPADIDEAKSRGYVTQDNSDMNIYEMCLDATNIILSKLGIDNISQNTIQNLVLEANQHYGDKID